MFHRSILSIVIPAKAGIQFFFYAFARHKINSRIAASAE